MWMQKYILIIIFIFTASLAFSETAKEHFDNAINKYYVENNLDGAIQELEESLKLDPDNEEAARLSRILAHQKRMESVGKVIDSEKIEPAEPKKEKSEEVAEPVIKEPERTVPLAEVKIESIPAAPLSSVEDRKGGKEVEEALPAIPQEEIAAKGIGEILKVLQVAPEYVIGLEDVLGISVWQNEELTMEVAVRPDGRISYPLIGDLPAMGLTLNELDIIITGRLREYVREPQVSIMIKKLGGKKVIVLGEVKSPGVYRFTGEAKLLEVIGLANGFTEDATLKNVLVIRGDIRNDRAKANSINVAKVWKEGRMDNNVLIEPMDIVYVPRSTIGNLNLFLRQITPALRVVYDSVIIEDVLTSR